MVSLHSILFFLVESSLGKKLLRFLQKILSPKQEIPVFVHNQIIYARTLDRIVALYLRKFSLSEGFEIKLFKSLVREGMKVIDVGANLGCYSLVAASLVGPSGKVFAFEPEPENFSLLLKNIKANGYQNIRAINTAVADKKGQTKLFLSQEHRGSHRIYDAGEKRESIEVPTISLDDFFEDSRQIDIIKIDVEGAEALIFNGMRRIIKANPQLVIFTEFWPQGLKMAGSEPEDFLKTVEAEGLVIHIIDEEKKQLEAATVEKTLKECRRHGPLNLLLKKK